MFLMFGYGPGFSRDFAGSAICRSGPPNSPPTAATVAVIERQTVEPELASSVNCTSAAADNGGRCPASFA